MKANVKIFAKNLEESAQEQINQLVESGVFDDCSIRIMPDAHSGKGCVIGFTSEYRDKIVPCIVGLDISCGVHVAELSSDLDHQKTQETIEKYVPYGREVHEKGWFGGNIPKTILERYQYIRDRLPELRCFRYLKDSRRLSLALGSLGGGEVKKNDCLQSIVKDTHCKTRPYREKL